MYEWFYSCKKAFRLFLRRVYVSKKSSRERSQTRPLRECEGPSKWRPKRSCVPNIVVVSIIIVCYLFFVPLPSAPRKMPLLSTPPKTYSETSLETAIVFNPKQVQKVHIPKDAKVEFARNWLSRNKPEIVDDITEANMVTFAPTRGFLEQAQNVKASVIAVDGIPILVKSYDIRIDTSSTTPKSTTTEVPKCVTRVSSKNLTVVTSPIKVSLDNIYPMVQNGGYYIPSGCKSIHKVAILVPYRNRTRNLSNFLYNIHPFLMEQNLEYRIFVVEQYGNSKFNKGRLFNAGYKEMMKHGWWRCVIFHDVDLLPLDRRILYTCPRFPRHMSAYVIDKWSKRNTSSPILFGGVTAMMTEHYTRANGHSNLYWGWGGEDYDMFWRVKTANIPIVRYNKSIARYIALAHTRQIENPRRYALIQSAVGRMQTDGLNSVGYKVVSTKLHHLFTHILIDVQPWGDSQGSRNVLKTSIQLNRPKEVVKHRRREPPTNLAKPSIGHRLATTKLSQPRPIDEPIITISPSLSKGGLIFKPYVRPDPTR